MELILCHSNMDIVPSKYCQWLLYLLYPAPAGEGEEVCAGIHCDVHCLNDTGRWNRASGSLQSMIGPNGGKSWCSIKWEGKKGSEDGIEEGETLSHCRGWQPGFIGWFVLKVPRIFFYKTAKTMFFSSCRLSNRKLLIDVHTYTAVWPLYQQVPWQVGKNEWDWVKKTKS